MEPLGSESAADYAWFADLANSVFTQASLMAGTFRQRGDVGRRTQWANILGWMADWCNKRADWHKRQARKNTHPTRRHQITGDQEASSRR